MSHDVANQLSDGAARSEADASGLVRAALEISARRRDTLARLREALERDDRDEAISLARIYTGLDDEACDRTDSRLN